MSGSEDCKATRTNDALFIKRGHELATELGRGGITQAEDDREQPANERRPIHEPREHRLEDLDHRPDEPALVFRLDPPSEEEKIGIKAGTSVIDSSDTPIRAKVLV